MNRTPADLASFGTLIVLDGIPLSNNANLQTLGPRGGNDLRFTTSANGGVDLRRIPASTIERVEVIRGVPSVRYGDLTQGAIVVETRAATVAPILEAKFDERTMEGSGVGGFTFAAPGHAGTLAFDLARTLTQPGSADDESTRIAGQLAHRAEFGARRAGAGSDPKLSLDTRIDFFQLIDDRPENPDVRPDREFRSRDRGLRVAERARLRLGESSHLSFAGTFSMIDQGSSSRAPQVSGVQPFTDRISEGRQEGFYIGGFRDASQCGVSGPRSCPSRRTGCCRRERGRRRTANPEGSPGRTTRFLKARRAGASAGLPSGSRSGGRVKGAGRSNHRCPGWTARPPPVRSRG